MRGLSGRSGKGRETLGEVRNGSQDPKGGSGRVKGASVRSGMGQGPFRGPGRVEGPSGRSGTGRGALRRSRTGSETLPEVQDGSEDHRKFVGQAGKVRDMLRDPQKGPGRVGGPSSRFGPGHGALREVRDGSRGPREGLGRVMGPSGRSGIGWGNLGEVRDRSGDLWGGPGRVG